MASKTVGAESSDEPAVRRTIGPVQMAPYGLGNCSGIYGLIGKARASRQCRVVHFRRRARGGAAPRTLLCLARLAAPARCRRRVRHRARLRLQAAELHGRARTGRLRAHLDRHCKRACSPPISPSCSALPTGRWLACPQLPACLHRMSRGIRESMWVSLLCALIEAGGLVLLILVGMSYWSSIDYLDTPAVAGGEPRRPPRHAERRVRLLRVYRLRGHDVCHRGDARA